MSPSYDFTILSPFEFERITRDLLQKHLGIFIESFMEGRDGGIDLRYATDDNKTVIIQAKRYKDWGSLKSIVKKEADKLKKLTPGRYILSTSVSLTPARKEELQQLLSPYILRPSDIFGADDLNNLIAQYSDIERAYPRLWLGSVNILQDIVNKEVRNWSSFTLEDIKNDIKTYVNNSSFTEAVRILKEHRYVIISGIPGIGKTTLAKMLAYEGLARGYEEFICILDDLDDASRLFVEGKRQIFYFDDFLGANTFSAIERNFDQKLLTFINAIQRDKNKVFILTTREYILSQATTYYEKLETKNISIAKCTVNLAQYTRPIRAEILYNHLAVSELPPEYIEELLKNKRYLSIINHKNFNPRVIEAYIDNGLWRQVTPDQFVSRFMANLDNPAHVWSHAFENHLSEATQFALLVLSTMGRNVRLEAWKKAFEHFCACNRNSIGFIFNERIWLEALRTLENCFIVTNRKPGDPQTLVQLHNPSIHDFIINYLSERPRTVRQLISSALYVEQVIEIFTDKLASPAAATFARSRVTLDEKEHAYSGLIIDFMKRDHFETGEYIRGNFHTTDNTVDQIEAIAKITERYPVLIGNNPELLSSVIPPEIFMAGSGPIYFRVQLLKNSRWTPTTPGYTAMLDYIEGNLSIPPICTEYVGYLKNNGLNQRLHTETFRDSVKDVILYDIDNFITNEYEAENHEELYKELIAEIGHDFDTSEIWEKYHERVDSLETDDTELDIEDDFDDHESDKEDIDSRIHEMMTSLRSHSS